ncbi:MAG: hypothetical protein JWM87_4607 [Candidatus Eremiobacteraeota bacterium]|nr:hypothetical protein [Candidatus Eremiobacteraeota bacterium]
MSRAPLMLALGAALLFASTACSGDKGPLAVENVQLAKDNGSGGIGDTVSEFHPKDGPMHCVSTLNKIESGAKLHIEYIALDAGGMKNQKIVATDLTTGVIDNTADAKFSLPNPWPVGKYRCTVSLNGAAVKNLDFAVVPG